MKKYEGLRKWYEKITFRRLLTLSMVSLVSVVFISFSVTVTNLSEAKIRQNVKDNMSIVVKQFDVYLDNYISNVYEGFLSFESNQSLLQLRSMESGRYRLSYAAASYVYLNKLLNQFLNANSACVYNVYLNFGDGRVLTQAYEQDLLKIRYTYSMWKERFPENKYYWVDADSCRDLIPDEEVGAVLFHLYEGEQSGQSGIILIALKQDFFENILDVTALDQEASLSILTDYGIMHFGEQTAWNVVQDNRDYLIEKAERSRGVQTEVLDDYYFMYENIDLTGWKLVYNVKESSISNAHYIMRDVMFITVTIIAAMAVLLGLVSNAVSYSLRALTKKVEDKDILDHEISLHSYAEITTLSNSLEKMRLRINHLLNQVELEQEAKRQIEVALLQEQIHPHFLYNTLYSIIQLCELKQSEKASEMLTALATFYRIGLNRGENIITVEEELKHVKNYLFIQHFRYSDLFDYTIDCDTEILNCRIPKMSLQPLVENAIYHGIKQKHEFGNICILGGTYDGENAYLEVHDDGPGIDEMRLEEIRACLRDGITGENKISFGLKNVDSRIKFEFGRQYGLEIESLPQDTCVRICFAMKTMKEDTGSNIKEKEKE
ncbi:MAG: sensor histidine kinase [Enterocloster sp.]